jgi:hypothetical protein
VNKETQYIKSKWFNEFPLGQESPGTRNWLDDAERKLGGDEKLVTYHFNEWRYRGNIEPGTNISASFGCSHCFGYGVNTPYSEIIEFANCAISGLSNDAIARMAYTYCEQFAPNVIVVLWTIPHRREWVDTTGKIEKFRMQQNPNEWQQNFIELQNNKWDEYNLQKNKLFLKHYCESRNIKLLDYDFIDNDNQARDGMHPGTDWHMNMAAKILEDLHDT